MIFFYFLLFLFSVNLTLVKSNFKSISSECISCICEATGKCQYPLGCSNLDSGYYCGPLQISWAYWADGGKLGDKGNKDDFEKCLTTKNCAEQTMINYMQKFGQDCNGDGIIDCKDFAILHKTGYRQCQLSNVQNSKFWVEFKKTKCFANDFKENRGLNLRENNLNRESSINRENVIGNRENNFIRETNRVREINRNQFNSNRWNVFTSSLSSSSLFNTMNRVNSNSRTINNRIINSNSNPNLFNYFTSNTRNQPLNDLIFNNNENFMKPDNLNIRSNVRINVINRNQNNADNRNSRTLTRLPVNNLNKPLSVITVNANVNRNLENSNSVNSNLENFDRNLPTNKKFSNATLMIDSKCLECICYGSTKCNLKMKCSSNFCGPFLISWAYWKDGGQLTNDYANCANNYECARQTVANYMAKHNRDCDLNQELTCDDFAIIHQLGGYDCESNSKEIKKSQYWSNYAKCYNNEKFNVFTDENKPITGYSIVPTPNVDNKPVNNNIHNSINTPLTNDWRPIKPNNLNNQPSADSFSSSLNLNNFNNSRLHSRPSNIHINENRNYVTSNNRNANTNENRNINTNESRNINTNESRNDNRNRNANRNEYRNEVRSENRNEIRNENRNGIRNENRNEIRNVNRNENRNEIRHENDDSLRPSGIIDFSNTNILNNYNKEYLSYQPNNTNYIEPEIIPIERNNRLSNTRINSVSSTPELSNVIPVEPYSSINTDLYKNNKTIEQSCLDCICEATTPNCNDKLNCFVNEFGEFVCGPYHLNRFFWVDAGRPQDNGEANAFEQCASDKICSQLTIKAYMQKHEADCNEDGVIDCLDYAAMQRIGRKACSLQNLLDSSYWNKFQQCYGFGEE